MKPGRAALRRLVITVCPREPGTAVLPLTRGARAERLDARAIARRLRDLVGRRRLADVVTVREACAGGCAGPGPNVSLTIHPPAPPDGRPDHVAIGWKTYVHSIRALDCLATIVDESLRQRPWGRAPAASRARGPEPARAPARQSQPARLKRT